MLRSLIIGWSTLNGLARVYANSNIGYSSVKLTLTSLVAFTPPLLPYADKLVFDVLQTRFFWHRNKECRPGSR
ncbi:hypothetical protein CGA21_07330 [Pseudomonas sp. PSB11]|nr:hypothetical protein [Pseudomonas sp. PSB11]